MEVLLQAPEIDINATDYEFGTALHEASRHGLEEVVEILIEKGADVNARKIFDTTALMLASRYDHLGVVEVLTRNEADLDAQDKEAGQLSSGLPCMD